MKVDPFMTEEAMKDKRPLFSTPYNGPSIPSDLRQCTPVQLEAVLDYLITVPLRELRTRQGFQEQYREWAHKRYEMEGWTSGVQGLYANLAITDDILRLCVQFQTWPSERYPVQVTRGEEGEYRVDPLT